MRAIEQDQERLTMLIAKEGMLRLATSKFNDEKDLAKRITDPSRVG